MLEGNELDALPVARHAIEARLDEPQEVGIRRWGALEDGDRADVHVRGAVFEVEEERVERAQALEPRFHRAQSVTKWCVPRRGGQPPTRSLKQLRGRLKEVM